MKIKGGYVSVMVMGDISLSRWQKLFMAGSKLSFTSTVASWITRSQKPLVNGTDTHGDGCTHALKRKHTFWPYLVIFLSLYPAFHEWQSYYFHCLAYYSIKPLIGLDSFYLLLVKYGSLGALKQLKNRVEKVNVIQA